MIFSFIFCHAGRFIHESIALFSALKNPNTNGITIVIKGFEFIITFAEFIWDVSLDANQFFILLRSARRAVSERH